MQRLLYASKESMKLHYTHLCTKNSYKLSILNPKYNKFGDQHVLLLYKICSNKRRTHGVCKKRKRVRRKGKRTQTSASVCPLLLQQPPRFQIFGGLLASPFLYGTQLLREELLTFQFFLSENPRMSLSASKIVFKQFTSIDEEVSVARVPSLCQA